jgi:hypothetical protein
MVSNSWKLFKYVTAAHHLGTTAVQDATTSRIQPDIPKLFPPQHSRSSRTQPPFHKISFLTDCRHSKLHAFCYVRHVTAAMTNTSNVPTSEFWRLSVRMQRGQELKCQGHTIPSYSVLRRDVPHTAGTAGQCDCSYVQDLITAQTLLCVHHDLWQQNRTLISPVYV